MEIPIASITSILEDKDITILFVITNEERVVRDLAKIALDREIRLVVATSAKSVLESTKEENVQIKKLTDAPSKDIQVIAEAQEILVSASVEGMFSENEEVLCVLAMSVLALIRFKMENIGIASIRDEMEDRVDIPVLQAVLNLSVAIAREGREGRTIGCLFVLGDTEAVLKNSRQLIINPFKGHSEEERNILNRENWETIKEFTQLDGAFIIDKKGYAVSVGRYVGVNWDIYLQGGLGGRHLAAASISKTTKAVSVTVSTSGTIRVFKDGKVIFKVSTL